MNRRQPTNSNEKGATARAMVQAVNQNKTVPTVLVYLYNGLIEGVSADRPCNVKIIEDDKYIDPKEYEGDRFVLWGRDAVLLREWDITPQDVEADLYERIEAARQCPRCKKCNFPVGEDQETCEACAEEA